jgi:hypothetical protein
MAVKLRKVKPTRFCAEGPIMGERDGPSGPSAPLKRSQVRDFDLCRIHTPAILTTTRDDLGHDG